MATAIQVRESDVTIESGGDVLPAFFALPQRTGPVPGAMMVHDIFGLRDLARGQARRLAAHGVAAVYPHLFRGIGPVDPGVDPEAGKATRPFVDAITVEQCMGDIEAGLDFLRSQPEVDPDRLIIWGYCWGGAMVLRGANRVPGLAGVVVWHGILKGEDLAEMDNAVGPILGLFGDADSSIPVSDVEVLQARCEVAGVETDFHLFPDAPHSFCDDTRPTAFNAEACKQAWKEVGRFIRERVD